VRSWWTANALAVVMKGLVRVGRGESYIQSMGLTRRGPFVIMVAIPTLSALEVLLPWRPNPRLNHERSFT
jgi:hypothetical protein